MQEHEDSNMEVDQIANSRQESWGEPEEKLKGGKYVSLDNHPTLALITDPSLIECQQQENDC